MRQEKISSYQLCMILTGFLSGSSIAFNDIKLARQDSWLSFLIGWGAGFILLWITLKIGKLHPGKTLVGIFTDCFGKAAGRIISMIFICCFIALAAVINKDFGFYSQTTSYPETPILFFSIVIILVCAFCIKIGIEVLGRISEIFICIALLNLVVSIALLTPLLHLNAFKPFLADGPAPVLQSGFKIAMVPFSEIFLSLMVFPSIDDPKKLAKSSMTAVLIGGAFLFAILLRNIMVLGADLASRELYPSFVVFKLTVSSFTLESLLDINFALIVIIKIEVCIYGAAKAIAEVFGLKEYKILVSALSALIVSLSGLLQKSLMESETIASQVIPALSVPGLVAFPLLVLIVSLLERKRNIRKAQEGKT